MNRLKTLLAAAASLLLLTALAPASSAGTAELRDCPRSGEVGTVVYVNDQHVATLCCGVGFIGGYCYNPRYEL